VRRADGCAEPRHLAVVSPNWAPGPMASSLEDKIAAALAEANESAQFAFELEESLSAKGIGKVRILHRSSALAVHEDCSQVFDPESSFVSPLKAPSRSAQVPPRGEGASPPRARVEAIRADASISAFHASPIAAPPPPVPLDRDPRPAARTPRSRRGSSASSRRMSLSSSRGPADLTWTRALHKQSFAHDDPLTDGAFDNRPGFPLGGRMLPEGGSTSSSQRRSAHRSSSLRRACERLAAERGDMVTDSEADSVISSRASSRRVGRVVSAAQAEAFGARMHEEAKRLREEREELQREHFGSMDFRPAITRKARELHRTAGGTPDAVFQSLYQDAKRISDSREQARTEQEQAELAELRPTPSISKRAHSLTRPGGPRATFESLYQEASSRNERRKEMSSRTPPRAKLRMSDASAKILTSKGGGIITSPVWDRLSAPRVRPEEPTSPAAAAVRSTGEAHPTVVDPKAEAMYERLMKNKLQAEARVAKTRLELREQEQERLRKERQTVAMSARSAELAAKRLEKGHSVTDRLFQEASVRRKRQADALQVARRMERASLGGARAKPAPEVFEKLFREASSRDQALEALRKESEEQQEDLAPHKPFAGETKRTRSSRDLQAARARERSTERSLRRLSSASDVQVSLLSGEGSGVAIRWDKREPPPPSATKQLRKRSASATGTLAQKRSAWEMKSVLPSPSSFAGRDTIFGKGGEAAPPPKRPQEPVALADHVPVVTVAAKPEAGGASVWDRLYQEQSRRKQLSDVKYAIHCAKSAQDKPVVSHHPKAAARGRRREKSVRDVDPDVRARSRRRASQEAWAMALAASTAVEGSIPAHDESEAKIPFSPATKSMSPTIAEEIATPASVAAAREEQAVDTDDIVGSAPHEEQAVDTDDIVGSAPHEEQAVDTDDIVGSAPHEEQAVDTDDIVGYSLLGYGGELPESSDYHLGSPREDQGSLSILPGGRMEYGAEEDGNDADDVLELVFMQADADSPQAGE
jgi:hypothetical protein